MGVRACTAARGSRGTAGRGWQPTAGRARNQIPSPAESMLPMALRTSTAARGSRGTPYLSPTLSVSHIPARTSPTTLILRGPGLISGTRSAMRHLPRFAGATGKRADRPAAPAVVILPAMVRTSVPCPAERCEPPPAGMPGATVCGVVRRIDSALILTPAGYVPCAICGDPPPRVGGSTRRKLSR